MSVAVDTAVALLPTQVTAATAADAGARRVGYRLVAAARPAVTRYCRARLGAGGSAADVARAVCRTVAATAPDTDDEAVLTAFVYRSAAAAVDAAGDADAGLPPHLAQMPPAQREVLVLRVVVGLSVEQTAAALRVTPAAVRLAQHHALQRLRAA